MKTHFSLNGYEAVCTNRFFDWMTTDPQAVSCDFCVRALERLKNAKTKPARFLTECGKVLRSNMRIEEQRLALESTRGAGVGT